MSPKTLSKICLILTLWVVFSGFAQSSSCAISDTSQSPILTFQESIEVLRTSIEDEAGQHSCETVWQYPVDSELAGKEPYLIINTVSELLHEVSSSGVLGSDYIDESNYSTQLEWPTNELHAHEEMIYEIRRSILQTTRIVAEHCAGDVQIKTSLLWENARYDTTGRSIKKILKDMNAQTAEVWRFFLIKAQWEDTDEYRDEIPFSIAPEGFSKSMSDYFSEKNIAACRDQDPRRKAIEKLSWKSFLAWWNFKEAIQIWKDAMQLLLYRWSQLAGSTETNPAFEARINDIVQKQKWSVGWSNVVLDGNFLREFASSWHQNSALESAKEISKKLLYNTGAYDFLRKTVPTVIEEKLAEGETRTQATDFSWNSQSIQSYDEIVDKLYNRYLERQERVARDVSSDPEVTSSLVQILENMNSMQEDSQEMYKNICKILQSKQATNIAWAYRC